MEARGFLRTMMRDDIGINAVRECAKLKRERLGLVLGNAEAANFRHTASARMRERVHHAYRDWASGGRGFGSNA